MQNNLRQRNNLGQFFQNQANQDQNGFPRIPLQNQILNPLQHQTIATFDLNPYNGNIDPSANDGLNLFLKSIEEHKEDTKLKFSQTNVKNLMSAFGSNARKFGWSALINVVPSDRTGQNNKAILKKSQRQPLSKSKIKQERPGEIVQQHLVMTSHGTR